MHAMPIQQQKPNAMGLPPFLTSSTKDSEYFRNSPYFGFYRIAAMAITIKNFDSSLMGAVKDAGS